MSTVLTTLLTNKHTTIAGVIYLIAKFGVQVTAIWMPQLKDKLDATANLIEGAAVAYGLFAAGDATKSATKQDVSTLAQATQEAVATGDTNHLTKVVAETKPPEPEKKG